MLDPAAVFPVVVLESDELGTPFEHLEPEDAVTVTCTGAGVLLTDFELGRLSCGLHGLHGLHGGKWELDDIAHGIR